MCALGPPAAPLPKPPPQRETPDDTASQEPQDQDDKSSSLTSPPQSEKAGSKRPRSESVASGELDPHAGPAKVRFALDSPHVILMLPSQRAPSNRIPFRDYDLSDKTVDAMIEYGFVRALSSRPGIHCLFINPRRRWRTPPKTQNQPMLRCKIAQTVTLYLHLTPPQPSFLCVST